MAKMADFWKIAPGHDLAKVHAQAAEDILVGNLEAGHKRVRLYTNRLVVSDCPVCGAPWPVCHGLCVAHEAMDGQPGPYHYDYNDDCAECRAEGYFDADHG